jgi:hypothetical protein
LLLIELSALLLCMCLLSVLVDLAFVFSLACVCVRLFALAFGFLGGGCFCFGRPANQGVFALAGDLPFPGLPHCYGVLDCVRLFRGVMFSLPAPTAGCWYQRPAGAAGRGCGVLWAEWSKPQCVGSRAGSP